MRKLKIFLSYGHDSNTPIVMKIRDFLIRRGHHVWVDQDKIKAGDDWRARITEGIYESDLVLSCFSKYSVRNPGVCRDEIRISIGVKGGNIRTILLEPSEEVAPPAMLSHIQWLDMSQWKEHPDSDIEYYSQKFDALLSMIETENNLLFLGKLKNLKNIWNP